MARNNSLKIWIDLDNSPHVPFFKPIIRELENKGIAVIITIRDNAQTEELSKFYKLSYRKIGAHYGKNKFVKIAGTVFRSLQLLPYIVSQRPTLGVSHGSRAMVVLSRLIRMPTLGIGDYEHAKGFFNTDWLMMPEIIPKSAIHAVPQDRILSYPGIKEDVYVPSFKPDPGAMKEFNIPERNLIAVIRPPAVEAHYHNPESEQLYEATIEFFSQKKDITMIILPRYLSQGKEIRAKLQTLVDSKQVIIPDKVFDGLNLIWYSDFVVSGGGTMNREAAALGVPVYSIFRGAIGAVDKYLSQAGRLILLESVADVKNKIKIERRNRSVKLQETSNKTLNTVVDSIVKIVSLQNGK